MLLPVKVFFCVWTILGYNHCVCLGSPWCPPGLVMFIRQILVPASDVSLIYVLMVGWTVSLFLAAAFLFINVDSNFTQSFYWQLVSLFLTPWVLNFWWSEFSLVLDWSENFRFFLQSAVFQKWSEVDSRSNWDGHRSWFCGWEICSGRMVMSEENQERQATN